MSHVELSEGEKVPDYQMERPATMLEGVRDVVWRGEVCGIVTGRVTSVEGFTENPDWFVEQSRQLFEGGAERVIVWQCAGYAHNPIYRNRN